MGHDLPGNRPSWAPNGEKGWTIGPLQEHYRCIRCFFTKTRVERDVNTFTFSPSIIPFPTIKLDDFLR